MDSTLDTRKRLDFEVRCEIVYEVIAASAEPLTIREIGEGAGLVRSPYLREILNLLIERGYIREGLAKLRNGQAAMVFWVRKTDSLT